jgi:hypothetical protein
VSPSRQKRQKHGCTARAFLACVLCLAAAVAVHSRTPVASLRGQQVNTKIVQASSDQPLWRVDLRSLGYPAADPRLQSLRGLDSFNTTYFQSDGVVAATFITMAPSQGQANANAPDVARPYRLDAIFLDAGTGKVLKQLEWQTEFPDAGIFPRYGGGFLFFSTERIVLYSDDWLPVKELPLSQLNVPNAGLAGIAESPSGKTLVLRLHQNTLLFCFHISTETLAFSQTPCQADAAFSVSDDAVAELTGDVRVTGNTRRTQPLNYHMTLDDPEVKGIFINEPGKVRRALCNTDAKPGPCLVPQFVNNETIVFYSRMGLQVSGLAGAAKFSENFNSTKNWIELNGQPVRPAADGERFAVQFNKALSEPAQPPNGSVQPVILGTTVTSSAPDRVDVFDLRENRWIYSLKNKNNQFKHSWGLALSPYGEKLAIESAGVIQVYALPPAAANAPHNP